MGRGRAWACEYRTERRWGQARAPRALACLVPLPALLSSPPTHTLPSSRLGLPPLSLSLSPPLLQAAMVCGLSPVWPRLSLLPLPLDACNIKKVFKKYPPLHHFQSTTGFFHYTDSSIFYWYYHACVYISNELLCQTSPISYVLCYATNGRAVTGFV